ncbi:MAG: zinc-ribbon domain-containing protein [Defluviitaleaceae bacterium]|nr:zinc-ribbon domain-containing protein [Defluviitaleaceae bacterium]
MKIFENREDSLAIQNPELSKQWHPIDNGNLTPNDVSVGSSKKVWWVCDKGHKWDAAVRHRVNGSGCPYCSGRRVQEHNSLQALNPELARQWHPVNNGNLTPDNVTTGSKQKVYWLCEKGHEWEATIQSRAKYGNGCPFCVGRRVCSDNSLQALNPELAMQWHPTKNGAISPNDVTVSSNRKVWWHCTQGHEWESVIYSRNRSLSCPICTQGRQSSFPEQALYFYFKNVFNDTESRYKYKDKWEIDIFIPSLNMGIEYDGVYYHKNKETRDLKKEKYITAEGVYLLRVKETEDKTKEYTMVENVIYCNESPSDPQLNKIIKMCFCYTHKNISDAFHIANVDVSRDRALIYDLYIKSEETYSLSLKRPKLANQWHPIRNLGMKPSMIKAGSKKKVWWQCEKGHEWEETVSNRVANRNCPYCSGRRAYLDNCLQTINPRLSSQWHPANNGSLAPDNVTPSSNKKVWWQCEKGHEWQESIANRTKGSGCPFCAGKRASIENCLQTLNPNLAKEWHPIKNETLTTYDVTVGSGKKVWWQCEKGHEWEAIVNSRTKGNGCPFCSGWRACDDNSLQALNPRLSKEWHPVKNGELTPSNVTIGSSRKVWWQCEKGHEWEATIKSRSNGSGCPDCYKMKYKK